MLVDWKVQFSGLNAAKDTAHTTTVTHLFPQGSLKRHFPLLLCLKAQYYVENGRLIWCVLLHMCFFHC